MVKSKYETHVKPYFDDIFFWRSHDWELVAIAAELGIAKSTFLKYKKEYSDLSDLLKKAEKAKPRYIAIKAEAAHSGINCRIVRSKKSIKNNGLIKMV